MKRVSLFMVAVSLLFLAGCQQTENLEPQNEQVVGSGQGMFRVVGDPRDPAEFMPAEEFEMFQGIFEGMQGKTFKNPVVCEGVETRGVGYDGVDYSLREIDIPVAKVNEQYLYLDIKIIYNMVENASSLAIRYRLGATGIYKEAVDLAYGKIQVIGGGDYYLFYVPACSFKVPLSKFSINRHAIVSLPIQMAWNKGTGMGTCEVRLNTQLVNVVYEGGAIVGPPVIVGPVIQL